MADPESTATWVTVLLYTVPMALVSGLGAVPFYFFTPQVGSWGAGVANSLACGVMLSASFDLIYEGQSFSPAMLVLGLFLGAAFIAKSKRFLAQHDDIMLGDMRGLDAKKAMLVVCIMTLHAIGEGSGVGVSFSNDNADHNRGLLITLAIAFHNIPEGLGVAVVLVTRGVSPTRAALWAIFTSLPQPIMAVPSFLFVESFRSFHPMALGFASGSMLYMVFAELLPDAQRDTSPDTVAMVTTLSVAIFEAFRMSLNWVAAHPEAAADVLSALGWSMLAGLSTSIGGAFIFCVTKIDARTNAVMLGFAAGVMVALSILDMILPLSSEYGWPLIAGLVSVGFVLTTLLGRLLGGVEVGWEWLHDPDSRQFGHRAGLLPSTSTPAAPMATMHGPGPSLGAHDGGTDGKAKRVPMLPKQRAKLRSAILTAVALALHNSPEGLAVGITSMSGNFNKKLMVAMAISLHNIPEGVAVAATIYQATGNRWAAFIIASCTGLVEPISAVLSVVLLAPFLSDFVLDCALLLVSGVMCGVSTMELIPQALADSTKHGLAGIVIGGLAVKLGLLALGEGL